jgi:hypothetical protein
MFHSLRIKNSPLMLVEEVGVEGKWKGVRCWFFFFFLCIREWENENEFWNGLRYINTITTCPLYNSHLVLPLHHLFTCESQLFLHTSSHNSQIVSNDTSLINNLLLINFGVLHLPYYLNQNTKIHFVQIYWLVCNGLFCCSSVFYYHIELSSFH